MIKRSGLVLVLVLAACGRSGENASRSSLEGTVWPVSLAGRHFTVHLNPMAHGEGVCSVHPENHVWVTGCDMSWSQTGSKVSAECRCREPYIDVDATADGSTMRGKATIGSETHAFTAAKRWETAETGSSPGVRGPAVK